MSEIHDLDKLLPEPKRIKLSGKILELHPGRLKTLIKLQKSFLAFQAGTQEDQGKLLDDLMDSLAVIIPDIKRDDVDITLEQLPLLIDIAYRASMPDDTKRAEEQKMTPTTEKKTEPASTEQ